ncbi:hypothetical protein BCR33DRAFT_719177 [Rhizoclosmatium globosum]|uniref:Uncharacterized protein n=1 Tax=Rhizoclosmatium globosum TaxID=329046 RepID=A0A1Y2C252_9FUNG|nr:hypothetical protein BCR33DRAFT_719177 [Rhizoclosmatium globosum]|eukprot:ORY41099.1 hypothetical protein BCR33DRAFT_719177 [Rhizoclosmatium globosum]
MYAIDQYYVEQQRLFMRGQQDVSPATSRCTSPSTSHSEQYSISSPSPDLLDPYSDARRWSPPQNMYSQSRPVQKMSSPQLSVITTSSTLLNQSDARPKSPVHYPSLTAPFAVLLTSNQVLHGSLYRTNPTPPGTLPYQLLHPSKKKKGFSLSSLFKKSSKDKLAPAFPGKLNACALAVFGNRVYVYDYVKGSLTGHAGAKRWVRGPMTEDMEVVRDYDARKGSVSSTASSRVAMYPGTLTQERPVVVLEISNACVAEDGIWVLHCSGMDLVRSGECVDLFLQASDCDEMVRWLQVLKRAALTK